jgi:DNA-binding response OmpR family regulator
MYGHFRHHCRADVVAGPMINDFEASVNKPDRLERMAASKMILIVSHRMCTFQSVAGMLEGSDVAISAAHSLGDSLCRLRQLDVSVVICDRDLPAGGWRALLAAIDKMAAPPLLIVTAPDADDKLWAEVLNLGGYDVLAEPLDAEEVRRVLLHAQQAFGTSRPRFPAGGQDGTHPGSAVN